MYIIFIEIKHLRTNYLEKNMTYYNSAKCYSISLLGFNRILFISLLIKLKKYTKKELSHCIYYVQILEMKSNFFFIYIRVE